MATRKKYWGDCYDFGNGSIPEPFHQPTLYVFLDCTKLQKLTKRAAQVNFIVFACRLPGGSANLHK